NPDVSALEPTQLLQRLQECRREGMRARIAPAPISASPKPCDAPHPLALLRPRRQRPRQRRTNNCLSEIASSHCLPRLGPHQLLAFNAGDQIRKFKLAKWGSRSICAAETLSRAWPIWFITGPADDVCSMSAFPSRADLRRPSRQVSKGP